VAEFIREKAMLELQDELPYAVAVTIERFEDLRPKLVRIVATLHVERTSQKGIVIGKGGARLKSIGARARKDVEFLLGSKAYLELAVRVTGDWTNDQRRLAELGYAKEKRAPSRDDEWAAALAALPPEALAAPDDADEALEDGEGSPPGGADAPRAEAAGAGVRLDDAGGAGGAAAPRAESSGASFGGAGGRGPRAASAGASFGDAGGPAGDAAAPGAEAAGASFEDAGGPGPRAASAGASFGDAGGPAGDAAAPGAEASGASVGDAGGPGPRAASAGGRGTSASPGDGGHDGDASGPAALDGGGEERP
jgi:hypothetical protein